jgi:hypothetical protein
VAQGDHSGGGERILEVEEFEPVDIRDIPDDELDDLFGGMLGSPQTKLA